MEDQRIIQLFFNRDETALLQTETTYGAYLRRIAVNVLGDDEDAKECVNDTLLRAWHAIPPQNPMNLKAFLGRITRNLALDAYDRRMTKKRGGGEIPLVLDELSECIPAKENEVNSSLGDAINAYLRGLDPIKRKVFVKRYFYAESVRQIAGQLLLSESNVKTMLFRMRSELKQSLEKEGVIING